MRGEFAQGPGGDGGAAEFLGSYLGILARGSEPGGSALYRVMATLPTWLWPPQPSKRPATSLLQWAGPSHLFPGHAFHIHIWTNWSLVSTHTR